VMIECKATRQFQLLDNAEIEKVFIEVLHTNAYMKVIVGRNGAIRLPPEVMKELGIKKGMMLKVEIIDNKIVLTPVKTLADALGIDSKEQAIVFLKLLEEERKKEIEKENSGP